MRVLRKAIVSDPHNVNLYVDFADISLDHQSFQVGVDMINAGLSGSRKRRLCMWRVACCTCRWRNMTRPRPILKRLMRLIRVSRWVRLRRVLAAVQQNDPERALATVQAKLARKPNDPFLLYLQAQILTQRGPDPGSAEFRQALKSAEKAIALRPSLADARDVLAKLYLQAGENEAAAEQSRKA